MFQEFVRVSTLRFFQHDYDALNFLGSIVSFIPVCILPTIMASEFKMSMQFGGTSLIILVGVALDTLSQIRSHLLNQNYEGLLKQARLRGRAWLKFINRSPYV